MFTSIYPVSLVSVPHFDVDLAIQNYIDFTVYFIEARKLDYGFFYNISPSIAMMVAIYIVDPLGINMLENQFLNNFGSTCDISYVINVG
jgi:hypothetical protein